jgi:hypothetical protein
MKQLPFVLSITLVVLSFTASTAHAEQVEKMDLCHYDDLAQGWVLINITENAVAKHMENHDDGWPGDATGVTVTALNQACEQGGLPFCGNCLEADETRTSCEVPACSAAVIESDPWCENSNWDGLCALAAEEICRDGVDPTTANTFPGAPFCTE